MGQTDFFVGLCDAQRRQFGPRGLKHTCGSNAPAPLAFDAYRALNFLTQQQSVDSARVAALGFSQGGWLALSSVERGPIERIAENKFRQQSRSIRPASDSRTT